MVFYQGDKNMIYFYILFSSNFNLKISERLFPESTKYVDNIYFIQHVTSIYHLHDLYSILSNDIPLSNDYCNINLISNFIVMAFHYNLSWSEIHSIVNLKLMLDLYFQSFVLLYHDVGFRDSLDQRKKSVLFSLTCNYCFVLWI